MSSTSTANTQPQVPNKAVTIVKLTSNSVSIRWNKAVDKETPQAQLAYTVTWCVAPYRWDNNIRKIGEKKYDNTSYEITGLQPKTTYEIIIYVRDANGCENTYARTTVTTPDGPAAPPPNTQPQVPNKTVTIVKLTSNSVSLRWNKAVDKETPQAQLAYTVTWCVAPYKWDNSIRKIGERKYDNTSYEITGLQPKTTYEIIIYVRDANGCENTYARTTVTTPDGPAAPPPNTQPQVPNKEVTIVKLTSNSVSIKWNKAVDKETPQAQLAYTVTWCVAPYKWDNSIRKIGERKYDNTSYEITGLQPKTTYEIIIYVRDANGCENTYARTTVTTPAEALKPNTRPSIPINDIIIEDKTTDSISIKWNKAIDQETPQEKLEYIVMWSVAPFNTVTSKSSGKLIDKTSYQLAGLAPNTEYEIILYVRDSGGALNKYANAKVSTKEVEPPQATATSRASLYDYIPFFLSYAGGHVKNQSNYDITLQQLQENDLYLNDDDVIDDEDLQCIDEMVVEYVLQVCYWSGMDDEEVTESQQDRKLHCDDLHSQSIANQLMDWSLGTGIENVVRAVQKLLGMEATGVMDDKTINAINKQDRQQFFRKIQLARAESYNKLIQDNPMLAQFVQAWMERTNAIGFGSLRLKDGETIEFDDFTHQPQQFDQETIEEN